MPIQGKLFVELFVTFMKIGGFTLGGGYAMLPIIAHEVVDQKHWVTEADMADFMTLAQASPGIIGINTATAVGYKVGGVLGGLVATLGMVTPSVVIITVIAMYFEQFKQWDVVQRAFLGVRAAVVAMLFIAAMRLYKASVKDRFQWCMYVGAAAAVFFFAVKPQWVILVGAVLGVCYATLRERGKPSE